MDNGDSGPRRFINFILVLLVLLVQLDVLEYAVSSQEKFSDSLKYGAVGNDREESEDADESYYYPFRSCFAFPLTETVTAGGYVPAQVRGGWSPGLFVSLPRISRHTYAVCCVYLI